MQSNKLGLYKNKIRSVPTHNSAESSVQIRNVPAGPLSPTTLSPSRAIPLRILMVIDQFNIGGTETYTLSLTRELLKKGATVVLVGKKGKLLGHFLGLGCSYYELDFVLDTYEPDSQNRELYIKFLQSIIAAERIDLVHGHQIPSGSIAITAADWMNVPFVFTVHGTYYDPEFLQLLHKSTTVTCVSPSIQRLLASKGLDSTLIPNGIDVMEYQPYSTFYRRHLRHKLAIPQYATVILYAGRLSWEKADICEYMIHITSALRYTNDPNVHLIITGGGSKQESIIKLVNNHRKLTDHPFIHYVGEVTDMCAYYCISDYIIGTGRIALEAMACERPLLAVGTLGVLGLVKPELYEKAWDSWFGDHDCPQILSGTVLANQLKSMLSLNQQQRLDTVNAGRRFVMDHFHISQTTEKQLSLYDQAIQSKSARNINFI
ncbi:Glycosyltransferase involved in cell wall bisynthesis [Paenibacillus sp. 1_12]|uniref:glycosyltransferase n=1 Tax=Paenibacillus sp. 1_12 TaxID=1566278 RepID=UPI0008E7DA65|nr:glycosyltransferase [Paenibacillus sp. 1_12]SFK94752.1 Glycosyltransferase involved in cell wall bisynthesis [Paenibacillus sp. 1_12]